jgi:hypothetical protein
MRRFFSKSWCVLRPDSSVCYAPSAGRAAGLRALCGNVLHPYLDVSTIRCYGSENTRVDGF